MKVLWTLTLATAMLTAAYGADTDPVANGSNGTVSAPAASVSSTPVSGQAATQAAEDQGPEGNGQRRRIHPPSRRHSP